MRPTASPSRFKGPPPDARDSGRAAAPLRPAADAIVLETTEMDADAAFETALDELRSRSFAEGR